MVSSIVPGAAGAGALGVDTRFAQRSAAAQTEQREQAANADRVELSGASLATARESVRQGVAQIQEALALGHEAMSMLLKAQSAARGEASQADLDAALKTFADRIEAALARGGRLAAGDDIAVQAEPGSGPVVIAGVDLRLKAAPDAGDVISVPAYARADDPDLPQAAQRSLERLQDAMTRLLDSMRALEAHQGFLGAVENAAGVRRDIDTDGARLLALQVRQGLEAAGAPSIANAEPQAVLTLFRA
jgi:hypothetical protein